MLMVEILKKHVQARVKRPRLHDEHAKLSYLEDVEVQLPNASDFARHFEHPLPRSTAGSHSANNILHNPYLVHSKLLTMISVTIMVHAGISFAKCISRICEKTVVE